MTTPTEKWTTQAVGMSFEILDRMVRAVERVRERLLRAGLALNKTHVEYAIAGGHAVAHWVADVDSGAVRNCPNIDFLVHRKDFVTISTALQTAGFVKGASESMFLDGPDSKPREAINLLFAGEKLRSGDGLVVPDIQTIYNEESGPHLALEPLVFLCLLSNKLVDKVYVRDLIDVGLIDASWLPKLPADLAERLKNILDTPDG
jgi:hypothetical protein